MKKTNILLLFKTFLMITVLTPGAALTHEPPDTFHRIKIETDDSRLASFANMHVQEIDQGVEVSGVLLRRVGHRNLRIRGHIHIEVLNKDGRVLDIAKLPLQPGVMTVRRDRNRNFSVTVQVPEEKVHSIRVSHNVGKDLHG